MPELPEVETMRRGILGIVGSQVVRLEPLRRACKPILISPRIATLNRRLAGKAIADVGRIGKRVVVYVQGGDALVFEPRMTGLVLLADPPTDEHLRVRVHLSGGRASQLLYWDRRGLGSVRLLSPSEISSALGSEKLGPDALALKPGQLESLLHQSRRAIKVALLDQRAVAGIGNLYASEILHLAGVHPECRCDRLSAAQWERIESAVSEILNTAIRYEGSTLSDGTYRNALNQAGGYQNHHRVYDRADESCPTCQGGPVVRIVQAQRATFFCPDCQRKRPLRSRAAK